MLAFPALTASISTTLFAGGMSGAVKVPSASIVPVAVLPPFTPFTRHATFGSRPSLTRAKNFLVLPARRLILAGLTVTEGPAGAWDGASCAIHNPNATHSHTV